MKRSFVPAGIFVLVLLIVAVGMKYYLRYENSQVWDAFLHTQEGYTLYSSETDARYDLDDLEDQLALSGFLGTALTLDRSVNGSGDPLPDQSPYYAIYTQDTEALVIQAEDPWQCTIRGRFFTHYYTGGQEAAGYLARLLDTLAPADQAS